MSIWTSRTLLLPTALAACVAGGEGPRTAVLGSGDAAFTVAAPPGYCTAQQAIARVGDSDFAAFAHCRAGEAASPILTATIGAEGSGAALPDPATLSAFFTSPDGRGALSRAGDPASVTVHGVSVVDGVVLIHLTDLAPGETGEGAAMRSVLTVGGRLVTLTVTGGRGAALAREEAQRLSLAFAAAVRRANAG